MPTSQQDHDTQYAMFLGLTQANLIAAIDTPKTPIFETDATGLFDLFLARLPLDQRALHTCRSCRKFFERYGTLATISEAGKVVPVMWDKIEPPPLYKAAAVALFNAVAGANIIGVYYDPNTQWGTPFNIGQKGETWRHLAALPPSSHVWRSDDQTAEQAMAEKAHNYETILRALDEYSLADLEVAVLITGEDNDLYRSEKVRGAAQWLYNLKAKTAPVRKLATKQNIVWRAVATAPNGFCHPRSGVLGTLLDDIKAGMDYERISTRFAEKMSPENYGRSTAAPTQGAIDAATKLFNEYGLEPALHRYYAQIRQIPKHGFIWYQGMVKVAATPRASTSRRHQLPATAFAGVQPRSAVQREMAPGSISWARFQRDVLPTAQRIEVLVPDTADRMAALVTGHPDAPPILQWDSEKNRNQFSWYYEQGIDSDIKRRVRAAGGKVEGVAIRGSLAWEGYTDLDLWCIGPSGTICYRSRRDSYGGELDVDANGGVDRRKSPVENIRWTTKLAPNGTYRFYVNRFVDRGDPKGTPFRFELEIDGQVWTMKGVAHAHNNYDQLRDMILVAEFEYYPSKKHITFGRGAMVPQLTQQCLGGTPNSWNLVPGAWAPVQAIIRSPNMWGDNPMPEHGEHAFFTINGCYDRQEGRGRGFFTETLKGKLRPVRSVLEAYNKDAKILGLDRADACGIGISNAPDVGMGDLKVRVNGTYEFTLARWD